METRSRLAFCLLALTAAIILFAADTLYIEPCDEVVKTGFGDILTLSHDRGEILRYESFKKTASYGGGKSEKYLLQSPLGLCIDDPGVVYCLDRDQYAIFSWDRALNLRHVIPLAQRVLSPTGFTVTPEHDWLIYDEFSQAIYRLSPESNYYQDWGDRLYSGDVDLMSVGQSVFIFYRDRSLLILAGSEGWTREEYSLPKNLDVHQIFPFNDDQFGLVTPDGVFLWVPKKKILTRITELNKVVYIERRKIGYLMITRDGMVVSLP